MSEPFTFYRALDPVKGSWDGYGFYRSGESDFVAFVTDAPSAASIHTPELIRDFWTKFIRENFQESPDPDVARFELADGINRLHDFLQRRSRIDGSGYQATLSIARKITNQLFYCSVGDSMVQLLRNGALYRLNDSEVWDGSLIIKESRNLLERQKTVVLRFVGDGGDFVAASAISSITLQPGDRLLFSTDGVEDLLPPDRLIPILKSKPETMRREFENIFAQEKLRDDITFLALDIEVPDGFDDQKEIGLIRSEMDALKKEQGAFRNDLTRLALPGARLERIEKNLTQIGQQVQALHKKLEALPKNRPTGSFSIPHESRAGRGLWLWIAGSAIVALLLAIGFLLLDRSKPVEETLRIPQRRQEPAPQPRSIAPPEISAPVDCNYVVEKGDSLEKIALKKKVDVDSLLHWNPSLKQNTGLKIGQKIALCNQTNVQ